MPASSGCGECCECCECCEEAEDVEGAATEDANATWTRQPRAPSGIAFDLAALSLDGLRLGACSWRPETSSATANHTSPSDHADRHTP